MIEKLDKRDPRVDYGHGIPSRKCALCVMFLAAHACTKVSGWIDPSAVCKLFVRKK